MVETQYCDTTKIYVAEISKDVAKEMIVKYHYSHAWTMCRYALGIFYKGGSGDFFDSDKLIGCMIYGFPVGRRAWSSISDRIDKDSVLELTRLYIDDGYGKNIESYALGQSFKWLRENDSNIKMLISYADPAQAHLGIIYQATNWLYQRAGDFQLMPNYSISIQTEPFDWIHSRTVGNRWGSGNVEFLRTQLGKEGYKEFWRKKEASKHRYLQILVKDKRERKKLIESIKHPLSPYPKITDNYEKEIEHYTTHEPTDTNFW
jgi:hypothetical protein